MRPKANATSSARRRFGTAARWGACFALVLCAHAAAAMALLDWHDDVASIASAPAILIDLAPAPAAPATEKTDLPPGPERPQAQASPAPTPQPAKTIEKAELTPAPVKPLEQTQAKPVQKPAPIPAPEKPVTQTAPAPPVPKTDEPADEVLTTLPPPRPHVVRREREAKRRIAQPRRVASRASAPSTAAHRAARAAAPAPGAARLDPKAVPNWQSRLMARLERYKRYPDAAQRRGEHGVARLAFNVDRRGGVHDVRILHSSGSSLLDSAALSLPRRAAPLPPPPAGLGGARVRIVVPIRYSLR